VNPGGEQCYLGSLTGAVSSQRVTEESQGTLSLVGNQAKSAKVEGCLTARPMGRAGAKAGLSDPAVLDGKAVAQQIKGTPGITGLSPLSVHSGEEVWHLNIGVLGKRFPTNKSAYNGEPVSSNQWPVISGR
jgi:Family of unknown function (DUF6467)